MNQHKREKREVGEGASENMRLDEKQWENVTFQEA
jgi:hypothetical protein